MTYHATFTTPLGEMTAVATGDALTGLYFAGGRYRPAQSTFGEQVAAEAEPVLRRTRGQLTEYFTGARSQFDLPIALRGSWVQEQVWELLGQIPYGARTTYGDIAAELGDLHLAQLVGQAVGHNPISIVVPCHRVLGANGSLTGYAGGIERKQFLLDLEEPYELRAQRLF